MRTYRKPSIGFQILQVFNHIITHLLYSISKLILALSSVTAIGDVNGTIVPVLALIGLVTLWVIIFKFVAEMMHLL